MCVRFSRASSAPLSSWLAGAALVAATGCSQEPPSVAETWQEPAQPWVEVWRDDFDGPAGTAPDPARWNLEIRPSGYNREQDYDTDERDNSFLDGGGNLVIQALSQHYVDASGAESSQPYTSARLNTHGKLDQQYGKFEARIKLPDGRGVWPAFWLLGGDIDTAGWPDCGEVDILEMRGSQPTRIISSLHGPSYSGGSSYHRPFELTSGTFADDFHVFTFEWTAEQVRWLVDGQQYYVKTAEAVTGNGAKWVYDHPFYVILNLAIGGQFDGDPDASTVFPRQMLVDYVSVSQLSP